MYGRQLAESSKSKRLYAQRACWTGLATDGCSPLRVARRLRLGHEHIRSSITAGCPAQRCTSSSRGFLGNLRGDPGPHPCLDAGRETPNPTLGRKEGRRGPRRPQPGGCRYSHKTVMARAKTVHTGLRDGEKDGRARKLTRNVPNRGFINSTGAPLASKLPPPRRAAQCPAQPNLPASASTRLSSRQGQGFKRQGSGQRPPPSMQPSPPCAAQAGSPPHQATPAHPARASERIAGQTCIGLPAHASLHHIPPQPTLAKAQPRRPDPSSQPRDLSRHNAPSSPVCGALSRA